jgi:hypothetical protein
MPQKKNYIFVMMRMQKPLIVRGAIFEATLESFANVGQKLVLN